MRAYLIRHGQGGPLDDYDRLSELGKRQAQALGAHFRASGVRFKAAIAGDMRRQQETAAIVLAECADAPIIQTDPRWNEFSLEGLWKVLAPQIPVSSEATPAADRVLTTADVELIRAWIANHHPCDGVETWAAFRARVNSALVELGTYGSGEAVAVFTSGTPTAICCGAALGLDERHILRIAAVLYNGSYTTLRVKANDAALFSLNNTAHLSGPGLLTLR